MADCIWGLWLRSAFALGSHPARRKFRTASFSQVEGLESRALLTTFFPRDANTPPTATSVSLTTNEDQILNGQLTGTDPDVPTTLSFKPGLISASHGHVVIQSDGSFSYIPDINFNGPDSFTFVANDTHVDSPEATVSITVTPVDDPVTVTDGSASPNEDLAFQGSLIGLTNNVDQDTVTYSVVTSPTHGTLTLNTNGSFTYTPSANYNGPDVFTFKANDTHADSNIGTFNLTVVPVDDPLKLAFSTPVSQGFRNNSSVRVDPAASVADNDTVVNYAKTQIRVVTRKGIVTAATATTPAVGSTPGDLEFDRIFLTIQSQGDGSGQVNIKGSTIYYTDPNNNNVKTVVGTFTGGHKGQALVITFSNAATEASVNAVLKQIAIQASKKATVATRNIEFTISAGGQRATGTKQVGIS